MKDDLVTKEEIRDALEKAGHRMHPRTIEKKLSLAGIEPVEKGSGRGKQAKYRRADAERILLAGEEQSTALTTTRPAALVALVAEAMTNNAAGFQSLRAALDSWPVWLTRLDAIARTGLPATWFDAGVRKGELIPLGNGRARRYDRDNVRHFAARMKDAGYLRRLLTKPTKPTKGKAKR